MSAYVPFDPRVHMGGETDLYATPATPATLTPEMVDIASKDVEISHADRSESSCDSLRLGATLAGKVAPSRNRVATDTASSRETFRHANTTQEALLEAQSRKSRKSRRGVEPHTHIDTTDMSPEKNLKYAQVGECQKDQNSKLLPSFDPFDPSPHAHISKVVLPPCVVCGGRERWDHHGIWRCIVCWPPEAFTSNSGGDSA